MKRARSESRLETAVIMGSARNLKVNLPGRLALAELILTIQAHERH